MKQNLFCAAANETTEICERDIGSTSLCSYHRLFSLLSVSVPPLFSPRAAAQSKRPADLAALTNFPLSFSLTADHLQTELSNTTLQLRPCGLELRARDMSGSLIKYSSCTDVTQSVKTCKCIFSVTAASKQKNELETDRMSDIHSVKGLLSEKNSPHIQLNLKGITSSHFH